MPVDTAHLDYATYAPRWKRCRDAIAGQDAVHEAKTAYLPKLTGQSDDEYKAYVARASFYNATGRTLDGMTGLIFRKAPVVEIPSGMEVYSADIDKSGTPLLSFAETVVDHLVAVGRIGVLVDYPPVSTEQVTVAQAEASGLRPYASIYPAESIISWLTGSHNKLLRVVLKECTSAIDPKDEFKQVEVEQWRVLDLVDSVYRVRIYQKSQGKDMQVGTDFYPQMNGKNMNYIPFFICGTNGMGAQVQKPPMIDLVNVNMSHYKGSADYEHGLHFTGLPTPYVTGYNAEVVQESGKQASFGIGSSTFLTFPNPESQVGYLEFTGQGLSALKESQRAKEEQMASLGARMLAPEKRAAESADTASIHRSGENSVLASIANAASTLLTKVLAEIAEWAKVAGEIKVTLNTDYLPNGMTAQDLTALLAAVQSGKMSDETFYWNLQQGELVPDTLTFEGEQERLAASKPGLGGLGGAE
jgi:hypothetical protein